MEPLVLSDPCPETPKSGNFGHKYIDLCFCKKLCVLKNWLKVISNMTMAF